MKKWQKKFRLNELVRIEWVDSSRELNAWVFKDDFELAVPCVVSVGYVWAVDEQSVAVAPHVSSDREQACGVMTIPFCAIKIVGLFTGQYERR